MLGVAAAVFLRAARYLPLELPSTLDAALGTALVVTTFQFIFPLVLAPFQVALAASLVVAALLAPSTVLARTARPWRLRPWAHATAWLGLACNHYVFDINPYLAWALVMALAAVVLDGAEPGASRRRAVLAASAAAGIAGLGVGAQTALEVAAALVYAGVVALVVFRGVGWFGARERRLILIAAGIAAQLAASFLPLALPRHGGAWLGDGLAYSFCEAPGRSALFAAVPEAPTMREWSVWQGHGGNGHVAEYDLDDLRLRAQHRFFSDNFHGRLEFLMCLDDSVQVGMTNVFLDGRREPDHVMSFALDDPARFERDLLGGGAGHGIAYDAARDTLYYVSERTPVLVRVDRTSGSRRDLRLRDRPFGALVVGPTSIDRSRDALYVSEWFQGRSVFEVDLATLTVRRTFSHRNGGAHGVTVDEEMDRLYAVGLWGMEVFDLRTGALIARKRLGMLGRAPAIDSARGLLYVPTTVEGKIRVFDRRSLEPRGAIPIGYGPRLPYFSATQDRLFSSSSLAHYSWSGAELAARFGGGPAGTH